MPRVADKRTSKASGQSGSTVEKTRQKVLSAAIAEFGEHGLAGARVDQIAKRAGVNKQALYYHYGDKESLFQKALVYGYEHTFRLPDIDWEADPRPAGELMRLVVGRCFELAEENQAHISLIADENRSKGKHLDQATLAAIQAATNTTVSAIRKLVARGVSSGEFRPGIDPEELYLLIIGQPIFYFNHRYTLSAILKSDVTVRKRADRHKEQIIGFVMSVLTG